MHRKKIIDTSSYHKNSKTFLPFSLKYWFPGRVRRQSVKLSMTTDNFGVEKNVNYFSCITMVDNIVDNMCPVAQSTNLFSGPMWPVCKVWIQYKGVGEVGQALLLIANYLSF